MDKYRVVDLFAGAGGLSLGFAQTQKFDIKVAFESNTDMQKTYKKNHPNVDVRGDVCVADYAEIQRQYGSIDVVIGGPPCQGFSNANRQKSSAVNQNNMLVKQYIRAILELQPKAFVMENVSMLSSDVHRFYCEKNDESLLKQYKIPTKDTWIELLGAPYVFEGALDIVQDKDQVLALMWPDTHYMCLNIIYKASKNEKKIKNALVKHQKALMKYAKIYTSQKSDAYIKKADAQAFEAISQFFNGELEAERIRDAIEPAIMIQRMLSKAKEIYDNDLAVDRYALENGLRAVIKSYAILDYLKEILSSKPNDYAIASGVLCAADYGAPQKRMRFIVMGIKRNISDTINLPKASIREDEYCTVHDAIADIEDETPVTELSEDKGIKLGPISEISSLGRKLRDSDILRNHIVTKTTPTALQRFRVLKQGQNFHALNDELKTNTYTDVARTQNTIYLRLDYEKPSGTVVNVRKSMWVHPVKDRAISVREAARLQTFPDSFVFCGSKDKQYQQVGNAVPPIMAKSIAKKLAAQLRCNLEKRG